MRSRGLGHRAPLLWLVLPLMTGLVLGRVLEIIRVDWLLALGLAAAITSVVGSRRTNPRWLWEASIFIALCCAGAASIQLHRRQLQGWDKLPPREVRVSLRVERMFGQADPRKASGLAQITRADAPATDIQRQRVYFSFRLRPGDPMPRRSSVVAAIGVLAPLARDCPPDSFDGYLASAGINFKLTRGRLLGEEQAPHAYYRFCDAAARRFKVILGTGIAEKRPALTGLLRAMMLGETRELTEEQHTLFMQSGTMHLFAISGLNIAVIAGGLQAILMLFRVPPWGRFIVGIPLLWLFVDITGAAPSAVRAFAMAAFFQAAFVVRRPGNTLAAVVASAALVLVLSPLQLFSASFLMSYAIVLALLVLGVPLSEHWLEATAPWRDLPKATWTRWQRVVDDAWRPLVTALAIGVATSLVSMITSVQFFQLLTPGALIANLVLIPAAMLVTLGGFVALLCGLVGFGMGAFLCNHASALVLLVIESLVRASVRLPGAFIEAHFRAAWIGGVALAVLLLALLIGYGSGWDRNRGGWWPPFAIVALTLIFGVRFG